MNRREVIALIKRNKNKRSEAITLISDFLVISEEKAEMIYEEEFGINSTN
jgi:hypothetical protein